VGVSLSVSEIEPLGSVLRLMARRGARSVALIDASGVLQGIVLDVDALRAIASLKANPPPPGAGGERLAT
jgi:CBS domain-containing protein